MGGLWATLSEFISPRSPADYRYQTLLPVEGSSSSGTDSRDRQDYSAGNAYGASPTHRRRTSGSVIPLEVFRSERSSPSLGGGTTQDAPARRTKLVWYLAAGAVALLLLASYSYGGKRLGSSVSETMLPEELQDDLVSPDLPSLVDDAPFFSDTLVADPNPFDDLPSEDVPSAIEEEFPSLKAEAEKVIDEEEENEVETVADKEEEAEVETVADEEEEIEEELADAEDAPAAVGEESTKEPLRTRVGPRQFPSLYPIDRCNAAQLLASLEQATISPDGLSRSAYPKPPPPNMDLSSFRFSFDLPNCPTPHIFTAAEACDLLLAFGGFLLRGDSLVRHQKDSLMMVISNDFDVTRGRTSRARKSVCRGNELFENGRECRLYQVFDSVEIKHQCASDPFVHYDQLWKYVHAETRRRGLASPQDELYGSSEANYTNFVQSLPAERQRYSPIYLHSTGIHYGFRSDAAMEVHIAPFLAHTSASFPQPIKLWSGYSAIGPKKPRKFLISQGTQKIKEFNARIQTLLGAVSPGDVAHGAWRTMEWYGITDGARSYDGTHHSWQVNMEKAQVLLNVLDTIWTEIVAEEGLVED